MPYFSTLMELYLHLYRENERHVYFERKVMLGIFQLICYRLKHPQSSSFVPLHV